MNILFRLKRKSKKILRDILNKEFIIRSKYGFKIKLDVSRDVDKHFYWNDFEKNTLEFFRKVLSEGNIVIDVGANIGVYTLIASNKVGKDGKVYSFEPSDWAFNRINENLKLNNIKNVIVSKICVSDKSGTLDFHKCHDDAYNSIGNHPMMDVIEVVKINSTSIDDFCKINNIKHVDVLKIDTEGADYLVLKGARNLLASEGAPVLFCEYNRSISEGYNFTKDDYLKLIKEYSYEIFIIKNDNLKKANPSDHKLSEIICLKEEHLNKFNLTVVG